MFVDLVAVIEGAGAASDHSAIVQSTCKRVKVSRWLHSREAACREFGFVLDFR